MANMIANSTQFQVGQAKEKMNEQLVIPPKPGRTGKSVFVVIPVFNRKEYTRNCLASFQQQDTNNFKVIVVDDGSTDGTAEMIRHEFPKTILLKGNGNLWWVGSINKGIRHALTICQDADFILVINDDLVIPPNYVSSLMNAAESNPGSIIGSVETINTAPCIIKSGGVSVNWKNAKAKVLNKGESLKQFPRGQIVEVDILTGRGTLFPSQLFREAGLYDEVHFKQCGDTELPVRANFKFGYPLLVSYDAIVISYPGNRKNINDKENYTLSDFKEYFFGIRSHFNLIDKFWIAYNIAPSKSWFIRYHFFNVGRMIGRFVTRLRFRIS
jgi:GT2 family glycosyltransferase